MPGCLEPFVICAVCNVFWRPPVNVGVVDMKHSQDIAKTPSEAGGLYMNSRTERDLQLARECAEMARSSNDPHLQRSFLELEKQWLAHAKKDEKKDLRRGIIGYWMRRLALLH